MRFAAGQFLGDRQTRRRFSGIELADMRPTVPRQDVHTHTHDEAHLLVLHRGAYLSSARAMPEVCVEPVVLLNPPGTHHRDCFHSLDDARFLTVSLDSALWTQATAGAAVPSHATRLPALALPEAYRLWRQLIDFDDTSVLAIEAEVQALLARSAGISDAAAEASGSAWLVRARARLEDDVGNVPGVAELAREAGLHPVYFARAFRRAHGCSPGDYLRQRRVELAIAGLCGGTQPLAEVAGACGFADQSHMSHALQRAVGLSPLQLRRLSRLQVANLQERRRRRAQAVVFAQRESPA
ncbi:helix-turn-helix domain-containing protein [Thermomonas carbonis]|uniref:Helix-turn-helix transcriptional regulator n=1 Tax=Thermomonas carbonis TaxID=1463158 RepID=A0A7G9SSH8_9GAMM|nr:AraC family transcriptional regulator [Thermomonas carbonis]QNN70803.1 helix-turn-helix transcriptional regulator [Thermomonas carbonis]GHC02522.1 AraC family transcriptional regulator [Thermomonas carbonis]